MSLSDEKGFTFIEVIIVMLIISILSVLTIPEFRVIERYRLKSQAEMLVKDLRYTQRLAMSQNTNFYFKLLKNDNGYLIRKGNSLTDKTKIVYMKHNIKFSSNSQNNIKYTSKGIPSNPNDGTIGSGGTIYLVSQNYKIKITVMPITGKVKAYDITKN